MLNLDKGIFIPKSEDDNNESEIFSPPFQPFSPTDSDLDKCRVHTSDSNSKNDSANNSPDEPDITSDDDIEISDKISDNERIPDLTPAVA